MRSASFQWLRGHVGLVRRKLVALIVFNVVHGGSGVLYALLLRGMVDAASQGDARSFFANFALAAVLVAWLLALRFLSRWLDELTRTQLENGLRHHVFESILYAKHSKVSAFHSGELTNLLAADTRVASDGYVSILSGLPGSLAKIAGTFVLLASFDPFFATVFGLGWLAFLLVSFVAARPLKRLYQRMREPEGRLNSFLQERLESLLVIKTYAVEPSTITQADNLMGEYQVARMERNRLSNYYSLGLGGVMSFATLAAAAWCAYGMLRGATSAGTLAATIQLVSQVHAPFSSLSGFLSQWTSMLGSAERLMDADGLCENRRGRKEGDGHVGDAIGFTVLGLSDLSFSYTSDAPEVMSHTSFALRPGEFVVLRGPSGCGKSTMIKLLLGVCEPVGGEWYLLDEAGKGLSRKEAWQAVFAYVPQDNQLLSGTVREAVCLACPSCGKSDEKMWEALHVACADDFVRELPSGADTTIGERGARLSEGQAQRLAVARAVCSERPILLLDEATSALDEETEARMIDNLRALEGRTIVFATHRPAGVAACGRVIEFSNGGIVEG